MTFYWRNKDISDTAAKMPGMIEAHAMVEMELTRIIRQREEIIVAFLAKYSLQPDEIEQVQETTETGWRWYVRRREK